MDPEGTLKWQRNHSRWGGPGVSKKKNPRLRVRTGEGKKGNEGQKEKKKKTARKKEWGEVWGEKKKSLGGGPAKTIRKTVFNRQRWWGVAKKANKKKKGGQRCHNT